MTPDFPDLEGAAPVSLLNTLSKAELDSLLARLRNRARSEGLRPHLVLKLYLHERLLARLSHSPHRDHFVLKGGLNLYSRFRALARPTVDIDLVGRGMPADIDSVLMALGEVMKLPLPDGVEFDVASLRGSPIQEESDYGGVRVEFGVRLGRARETVRCDVSFGAPITPGPVTLEFPALLEAQGYFLLGYPVETILAEKTAASVELGLENTRQKDFYDLYQLSTLHALEAQGVREALKRTFAARGTALEGSTALLEKVALDPEMRARWQRTRNREEWNAPPSFEAVMDRVLAFLGPLLEGTARGEWQPDSTSWME